MHHWGTHISVTASQLIDISFWLLHIQIHHYKANPIGHVTFHANIVMDISHRSVFNISYKEYYICGGFISFRNMGTGISNTSQKMDKAQHNIYVKNQPLSQLYR